MKQKCSSETKNIKPRKLVRVDCFEYETKQGQKNEDIDIIIERGWWEKPDHCKKITSLPKTTSKINHLLFSMAKDEKRWNKSNLTAP